MATSQINFVQRLWLALTLPFRVLFNATLGNNIYGLLNPQGSPEPNAPPTPAVKPLPTVEPEPTTVDPTTALQVLAILQREGRFIDFLQEEVTQFSDEEVGAAARVVHEGCKRGLKDHLALEPVRIEEEGTAVELAEGFDAHRLKLTGNVCGKPPFKGRLAHPGWQVKEILLPTLSDNHDPRILAPAEIEL